ncbi:recombination mediator RecR [Algivirga pacifica]|uniref:Recombination protein RecR n=1 Tax=Algivirga pacifica TaxID=1162670 RepID=A0ABP9D6W5_9BACT
MNYPSKLIEEAVQEIAKLPGIGKKTALRLVFFLLKQETEEVKKLSAALLNLREKIRYCQRCGNIAEETLCQVCASPSRDKTVLCIVEGITDVMAIESTTTYHGVYHILGGVISPLEGIGPEELNIPALIERIKQEGVQEVIFALNASMEADTTAFYITRKLKELPVKITTIARGIPVGGELEYIDELTLSRSIQERVSYRQ